MVGKTGGTNKKTNIFFYRKYNAFITACYCLFPLKTLIFTNFKGKIRGDDICKYLELKRIEIILQ